MKVINTKFLIRVNDKLSFHPKFLSFMCYMGANVKASPDFEVKKCTYYKDYISLSLYNVTFPENGDHHICITNYNKYYPVGISKLNEYDGPIFVKIGVLL